MNNELKPCPFCGGDAEILQYSEWHIVFCKNCYSTGSSSATREGAAENWNNRADPLLTMDGQVINWCSKIKRHITKLNVEGY